MFKRFLAIVLLLVAATPFLPAQSRVNGSDRLELQLWTPAGNKGNTGGAGPTAVYWQIPYTDSIAEWHIQPDPAAPTAYQNAYWYFQFGPHSRSTKFTEEFDLWVPAGARPQAIEFEAQQQISPGLVFNYAWQFNYAGGTIRKFNFGAGYNTGDTTITGAWVNVASFTPFTTNVWHHIKATWERTPDLNSVHDTLEIDGVSVSFVPVVYAVFRVPDSFLLRYNLKLNAGFQLDMNPANGAFSVFTRNMSFTWE